MPAKKSVNNLKETNLPCYGTQQGKKLLQLANVR